MVSVESQQVQLRCTGSWHCCMQVWLVDIATGRREIKTSCIQLGLASYVVSKLPGSITLSSHWGFGDLKQDLYI